MPMKDSSLPWHMNRTDQRNVREATGGDVRALKLNHTIIHSETIAEIDECLRERRHGLEYAKLYSGEYEDRLHDVPDFVSVCRQNDVIPYIGGGETESAIVQGRLSEYIAELKSFQIDTIEISNSDGNLPASSLSDTIKGLRGDFRRVLVEIGTKEDCHYRSQDAWHRDLDAALEADADAIILEGTGAGDRGIYSDGGESNTLLVTGLAERAGERTDRFLIEAPREYQRNYWLAEMFGWKMRLGNIPLDNLRLSRTEQMRVAAMQPKISAEIDKRRQAHRTFYAELMKACDELRISRDAAIFHGGLQNLYGHNVINHRNWQKNLRSFLRSNVGPQEIDLFDIEQIMIEPQTLRGLLRQFFGCDYDD